MKTFIRVVVLIIVSTLVACGLFPVIEYFWNGLLAQNDEPTKVFKRLWMICVLLGLILDRKALGFRHPRDSGYALHSGYFKNFCLGLGIVWGFLIILTSAYLLVGLYEFEPFQPMRVFDRFWQGLLQGMIVGFLEEYIFRGMIFYSMITFWGWKKAAVISSVIFSSLHFLEGGSADLAQVMDTWWAGFWICGFFLSNMVTEFTFFPDAFGLFVVGLILCYAAYQTGSLWYSVGLHGGWVFFAKFQSSFLNHVYDYEFWVGGSRMINGAIPVFAMLVIFPITYWLLQTKVLKQSANGVPFKGEI